MNTKLTFFAAGVNMGFSRAGRSFLALGRHLGLVICLLLGAPAHAANLLEVYQSARDSDPVVGIARAGFEASRERVPQARSALLPQLVAGGSTSKNERSFPVGPVLDQDPTSPTFGQLVEIPDQDFNDHGWQASLSQPVFDLASWFNLRSAKAAVTQAEFDLAATEQELIVRVIRDYLNVLRAQDLLDSTLAEEAAVKRQLEQVQQRFDVGLVAITDVLESQAVYDNSVVRRIQADGDHDIFFETLSTLTGEDYEALDRLSAELPIVDPDPQAEEEWVATALAENLGVLAAQAGVKSANRATRARRAGHLPTIGASVTYSHAVTGGVAFLGNKIDTTIYALEISLPIYLGGLTRSQTKEALALADQARESLDNQRRTVTRDTRNLYRAVATDVVRVRARLKAIQSAESALEATETGYEVGTRNIVDVLQAQQRLYSSQFDYADSRYNYVINLMFLKQAAGTLTGEDLEELNRFMDASNPVRRLASLRNRSADTESQ